MTFVEPSFERYGKALKVSEIEELEGFQNRHRTAYEWIGKDKRTWLLGLGRCDPIEVPT